MKKREDKNFIIDKKIQILLHANDCLNERCISSVKLYYDIGIIIASSIILIGIYAVINKEHKLFLAIPLLIALGEFFYLHTSHIIMRIEWYMIKNFETKFDKMIQPKILNFTRELGTFRDVYNPKKKSKFNFLKNPKFRFSVRRWIFYLGGYILFFIIALILNFGEDITVLPYINFKMELFPWSLLLYSIILEILILDIYRKYNEFNNYINKIKKLKKLKNN